MKAYRTAKAYRGLNIACFAGLAVVIMLTKPAVASENRASVVALGILFWLLLILGIVMGLSAAKTVRREMERRGRGQQWTSIRIGLTSFFQSREGLICDILLILCVVGIVTLRFTMLKYRFISYALLGAFPLLLDLHCYFNGRTFCYIETIREERLGRHEKH